MLIVTLLLGGIVAIVLLLVLAKWWIGCSARVRQAVLICLLLISLLANAALLVHRLVSECLVGGDGQFEPSPNGVYTAKAFSPRPCFGSKPAHYLFAIESRAGQPLETIRIDPGEPNVSDHFRELPQIIHWSADSREVEFHIPRLRRTMTVKDADTTLPRTKEATRK